MKDKIYECEVKRQYLIDGQRSWKWKRTPVSEVLPGEEIRCHECKSKVRHHKRRVSHGPKRIMLNILRGRIPSNARLDFIIDAGPNLKTKFKNCRV